MKTKQVTLLFKDYIAHGLTPYGACLNTANDIAIRACSSANRKECLAALTQAYATYAKTFNA